VSVAKRKKEISNLEEEIKTRMFICESYPSDERLKLKSVSGEVLVAEQYKS